VLIWGMRHRLFRLGRTYYTSEAYKNCVGMTAHIAGEHMDHDTLARQLLQQFIDAINAYDASRFDIIFSSLLPGQPL